MKNKTYNKRFVPKRYTPPFEVNSRFGENDFETIVKVAGFIGENKSEFRRNKVFKAIGWDYGDSKVCTLANGEEVILAISKGKVKKTRRRNG